MTAGLNRHLAPISPAAWQELEDNARDTLTVWLAGRKLVDFTGPLGWDHSAIPSGRLAPVELSAAGGRGGPSVQIRQRVVHPLLELRVPFRLSREELDSIDRGNQAPDLDPLIEASRRVAAAEDTLVFQGLDAVGIQGIHAHAGHPALEIGQDYNAYPRTVAHAVQRLRAEGIAGPYALALGPRCWEGLNTTTSPAGFPVIEHVRRVVDGPIVWAPAVSGAVVLSQRGGDFELVVGRDLSIGYLSHDRAEVELFIEESVHFRMHGPDAAVPLVYA